MGISFTASCRHLRLGLVVAIAATCGAVGPPLLSDDEPRDKPDAETPGIAVPTKVELTEKRMLFMKTALGHYTVQVGDRKEPGKVADPCLRFTNPLSGVTDGVIAVYASDGGRPDMIGQFFRVAPRTWVNEFAIISEDVSIVRSDRVFWKPSASICNFIDLPDSPVPAAKPLQRLVQMRAMAADFSVVDYFGGQEITKHNLRLLTQPVYRYSEEGKILDGCLFEFVLGTNPECSLLLEAYRDDRGSRYRFALSPVTIYELEARYKDAVVWTIERRMVFGNNCRTYFAQGYQPDPGESVPE